MNKKLSTGLALHAGKQPNSFLEKRAMGASAEARHAERRSNRLAQKIRTREVISDLIKRPTAQLHRRFGR